MAKNVEATLALGTVPQCMLVRISRDLIMRKVNPGYAQSYKVLWYLFSHSLTMAAWTWSQTTHVTTMALKIILSKCFG